MRARAALRETSCHRRSNSLKFSATHTLSIAPPKWACRAIAECLTPLLNYWVKAMDKQVQLGRDMWHILAATLSAEGRSDE